MSNKCGFCKAKNGVNMMALGDIWLEYKNDSTLRTVKMGSYCSPCGDKETLTNRKTGHVSTINAVFDSVLDNSARQASKSVATKTKVTTTMMETFSGATWHEKSIDVWLIACSSCGLMWDRKSQAESCKERGHVESFPQSYGGYVENGVYKPANTYIRNSYGRK